MNQLLQEYRKRSVAVCLTTLPKRLRHITVARAVELLEAMECGNDTVWWVGVENPAKRFQWTIRQFGQTESICEVDAATIREIVFYGGPFGNTSQHKGTLLTVLIDRLLCVLNRGGFSELDRILPLQENYSP